MEELNINPDDFENEYLQGILTIDEQAYIKLKHITKCLNEGWTPDLTNKTELKYWNFLYRDSAGSFFALAHYAPSTAHASFGSRLCFRTKELADFALAQFFDTYKEFVE